MNHIVELVDLISAVVLVSEKLKMKKKTEQSKKVSIEFDEKHLPTLVTALEVYSRLRSGQIAMAMANAFIDKNCLNYTDTHVIESVVKTLAFREEEICTNPNSYYGVGCEQMKDGTVAWEIKKVIDQYLHYQQNDGYRTIMNVSGDGAMQYSKVPIPKVINTLGMLSAVEYWKPQKEFRIPQRYQEAMDKAIKDKDFTKAWEIVVKSFKNKPLPKGSRSKIEEVAGNYYVVIEQPYKID
jgi:hypothetical protein